MSSLSKMNVVPAKRGGSKGSTLHAGMPGYIDAKGDGPKLRGEESKYRGTKGEGFGPHSEGSIGKRGKGETSSRLYRDGKGMITKSYHADSTGRPGTIRSNGKAPPKSAGASDGHMTAKGHIGGPSHGSAATGHHAQPKGHPGRMEHMVGRAKTAFEGRRKSRMY